MNAMGKASITEYDWERLLKRVDELARMVSGLSNHLRVQLDAYSASVVPWDRLPKEKK